ncbi:MAG: hypothetical protein M3409_10575 [Gemmatimonadota bacterium]|nr:hypothetical protein [Gemmatimonadota bacterium]
MRLLRPLLLLLGLAVVGGRAPAAGQGASGVLAARLTIVAAPSVHPAGKMTLRKTPSGTLELETAFTLRGASGCIVQVHTPSSSGPSSARLSAAGDGALHAGKMQPGAAAAVRLDVPPQRAGDGAPRQVTVVYLIVPDA